MRVFKKPVSFRRSTTIGTGPVLAGVLGKKKFIYDLWGDTVNIASRIAADCTAGMMQVDATSYRRIRSQFEFEAPRTVQLKGKGGRARARPRSTASPGRTGDGV